MSQLLNDGSNHIGSLLTRKCFVFDDLRGSQAHEIVTLNSVLDYQGSIQTQLSLTLEWFLQVVHMVEQLEMLALWASAQPAEPQCWLCSSLIGSFT